MINSKKICFVANGYAEEMIAANLMKEIRQNLNHAHKSQDYQLIGGSLVSSGKWYHAEKFATFFSGGVTPSGGFPTKSIVGFCKDLMSGAFLTPFRLIKIMKEWSRYNLDLVVVVGDFFLMSLVVPAIKKKKIPLVFIPTAKSNYIQPHFNVEKKSIKKYSTISFPRDQITTDDFHSYGINAHYNGNLIQDLLNRKAELITSKFPIVAILPGSREEAYSNLKMILNVIFSIEIMVHWAFVQASSLDIEKVEKIFIEKEWIKKQEGSITVWENKQHKIYCYPNAYYDSVALSCQFAISLAGTASEQIAGLGKPVIGFKGSGPQSSDSRMKDNQKLLGDAFIYAQDFPIGVTQTVLKLMSSVQERDSRGKAGIQHMGQPGATKEIADYICQHILEKK